MGLDFEYWICPECSKENYLGRSSCKKCSAQGNMFTLSGNMLARGFCVFPSLLTTRFAAPPEVAARRKRFAPTPADEVEAITMHTLREIAGTDDLNRADLMVRCFYGASYLAIISATCGLSRMII